MRPFPADDAALEAEIGSLPADLAKAWAACACEEAVGVWERQAGHGELAYRDSIVGLRHEVSPSLPRRALAFSSSGQGDGAALAKEYREPVTALQDEDWSLPEVALFAFYACYNALAGRYATAILQARRATFLELGDRERFDAVWGRWWLRCQSLEPSVSVCAGLPVRIPCERFLELAARVYRELAIPVGPGSVVEHSLPPPSYDVEAVESKLWSDGPHSAELIRTWDQPVAFQSRDRSFEAWMTVPEHGAKIRLTGMDNLEDFVLEAKQRDIEHVRAAVDRAATALAPEFASLHLQWTCLAQRDFDPLPVKLPDTSEAALVGLARRVAELLVPGFSPRDARHVLKSQQEEEIAIGEYSLTSEVIHGDMARGFRVTVVERRSTDPAGPSCSEVSTALEVLGLPAGLRFELGISMRPVPFRNAGLAVTAELAGDWLRLCQAQAVLHGVFREGQVAE